MADIITRKGNARRSLRVDLTPMVDLGFLLISFFIFTTTLSEAREAKFYLPANGDPVKYSESKSLTIVPANADSIWYFEGELETALQRQAVHLTGYDLKTGIGAVIRGKQARLAQSGSAKDLTILVCPQQDCSYKNIVDIMDEMLINGVKTYTITDDATVQTAMPSIRKAVSL